MPLPHRIDELLAAAEVLADRGGEGEIAASRRRIEAEFAAAVRTADARGTHPHLSKPQNAFTAFLARRNAMGAAAHEQAARDLRELSAFIVSGPRAAGHIAHLAASHQITPDGALTFACLLHLAEREDSAEILWQFAAGAGMSASAACLYLLHFKRGDVRDARHWAVETAALERLEDQAEKTNKRKDRKHRIGARRHRSVPARPADDGVPDTVLLLHALHALREPATDDLTFAAFQARTGALPRSLAQAVQSLETQTHPDYGPITWPDQDLAERLQHHLPA